MTPILDFNDKYVLKIPDINVYNFMNYTHIFLTFYPYTHKYFYTKATNDYLYVIKF